jgi:putative membrane protein
MRKIREKDMFIGGMIVFGSMIAGFFFPQLAQTTQHPLYAIMSLGAIAAGTFFALQKAQGTFRAFLLMAAIGISALIIESIGVATGFPYSSFTYGDALGEKIGNLVPWTVSIAFPPLLFIAHALGEKYTNSIFSRIILATIILVSIDLVLDPTLTALKYWSWEKPGVYYGVPLQNFFGWVLSGLIMHTICAYIWKPKTDISLLLMGGMVLVGFWTGAAGGFLFVLPIFIGLILLPFFARPFFH